MPSKLVLALENAHDDCDSSHSYVTEALELLGEDEKWKYKLRTALRYLDNAGDEIDFVMEQMKEAENAHRSK